MSHIYAFYLNRLLLVNLVDHKLLHSYKSQEFFMEKILIGEQGGGEEEYTHTKITTLLSPCACHMISLYITSRCVLGYHNLETSL